MMTPVEFRYAFDGWLAEKEERLIQSWEQTRYIAYHGLLMQMKPGDRKPMKVLLPMVWDSKEETEDVPEITYEERLQRVREFRKMKEKSTHKE